MGQLVAPDADAVASAFALGAPLGPARAAARAELGRIWSLETDSGRWAVKELWQPMSEAAARADVEFQRAARSAGLLLPQPRPRPDGRVRPGPRCLSVSSG